MNSLVVICLPGESGLATCEFDSSTGQLELLSRQPLPGVEDHCGGVPMAASPDGRRVYVAWRGDRPRLFSFSIGVHARPPELLAEASLPASMCYAMLASCGRRILTSSYTESTIALSPVGDEGHAGAPLMVEPAAHAHCLVEAPGGLVYATSLRGDFIQVYTFSNTREALLPAARFDMTRGSGPRHLVFTADGKSAFLISEFAGTVTHLAVEPQTGALSPRQSIKLLPEGKKAWAAELRLSADERYLHASERNSSQIFTLRRTNAGGLECVGATAAPECPRAFGYDASGTHLIALGERSGEAQVYRIGADGDLATTQRLSVGAAPSWMLAVPL